MESPWITNGIKKSLKKKQHLYQTSLKKKKKKKKKTLSINKLKDAFFLLDINRSPDFGGISFTVLKKCFGALHKLLLYVFNL